MASVRQIAALYLLLLLLIGAHIGLWFQTHELEARWLNVPPVPTQGSIKGLGLGDPQLAFRSIGIMLQNMGDMNGTSTALKDYDFPRIGQWLRLADQLDSRSSFMPFMAAFYFGGTQKVQELPPIIDYLEFVGKRNNTEDWRWLVQAAYLARFRLGDLPRALVLAQEAAALYRPGRPLWLKELPAFVETAAGDKKSAYALMLATLKAEQGKVPQPELNSTIAFVCTSILTPAQAATDPVCKTIPAYWYSPHHH